LPSVLSGLQFSGSNEEESKYKTNDNSFRENAKSKMTHTQKDEGKYIDFEEIRNADSRAVPLLPLLLKITTMLSEKINNDLKQAMLNKDEASLRGIRAIKSAILLAKTEKGGNKDLNEDGEIKLLQKLVKQRKDSLEIYEKEKQGRSCQKRT
jgi:hypothetical protein